MIRIALLALYLMAICPRSVCAETVWPQFRGAEGQGHSTVENVPLNWSESQNIAWSTPVLGKGWSSPVFLDGKIWMTSAVENPLPEKERAAKLKKLGIPNSADHWVPGTVELYAICIDLETGKTIREIKLAEVASPEPVHAMNSFASPSPIVAPGRVYCHFGAMGTFCIDTETFKTVWEEKLELLHYVGPGSSPVLHDGLLIITCDGANIQYIEALNASTGKRAWHRDRPPIRSNVPDFQKSYSTPLIIHAAGRDQCIIPGAQWIVSYDPKTGEEIWRVDHGRGFSIVPRPVWDGERVYVCTGFLGSGLLAIRCDGSGDVTKSHIEWAEKQHMPHRPSPLLVDDLIFTISEKGILNCRDTKTGTRHFRKRVPGNYSASPLLVAGRIYLSNHEGQTTVIEASKEFRKLAENNVDGQIMASLAVVDNDLLLRTDTRLLRIENKIGK